MSRELLACSTDFAVRKRCTWLWSVPKYESMRNVPPIMPVQNVYVSLRSNEKSNARRRPVEPAIRSASSGPIGMRTTSTIMMATSATMIRTICLTSAHATACTPPSIV